MRRREFIVLIGIAVAAWPLAVRSQQPDRVRRLGVLMNRAADSSEGQARIAAIQQRLQQLGWRNGQNLLMDVRWGASPTQAATPPVSHRTNTALPANCSKF
jgi:putative ABC transport system substrate-binding protein